MKFHAYILFFNGRMESRTYGMMKYSFRLVISQSWLFQLILFSFLKVKYDVMK